MATSKQYYASYVKNLNLMNERRLNLRARYLQISKRWSRKSLVLLFHMWQLNSLSKALHDVDSSFEELSTKRSFLWGMVSQACTVEEQLSVCKQFDYVFEEVSSLKRKLDQIDYRLQKHESK